MVQVTVCIDFGSQEEEITTSTFSPSICHTVMGPDAMVLLLLFFLIFSPKLALLLSLHPHQEAL